MYEKIIITGVPGTGKTTIANMLGEHFMTRVIHITDYIKENELIEKKLRDGTIIPKMKELRNMLNKETGIIEGHLACEFKLRNSFVLVLRCHPEELKKRLKKRGYSTKKIKENVEAEALDYCTQMARQNYKAVFEIDTTNKKPKETFEKALKIIYGTSQGDDVDFSSYLEKQSPGKTKKKVAKKKQTIKKTKKKTKK